jgi:hypothetical protein
MKLIDIVLQGKFSDYVNESANYYLELPYVNKVIISCWETDEVNILNNSNIEYVISKIPQNQGTGRRNYQIISSLNGLKKCKSKYSVKFRNDQRYFHDSMNNMYEYWLTNNEKEISYWDNEEKPKGKIFVGGNFIFYPFHPRDHFYWGYTEDLIDLFDIPMENSSIYEKANISYKDEWKYYKYYTRVESYIGAHYASRFFENIKVFLLMPEKYLYDESEKIQECLQISYQLTPKIFKCFPKNCIKNMEWPKHNWKEYPFDEQYHRYGERWAEDGV